jgi:hypothetical protein
MDQENLMLTFRTHVNHQAASELPFSLYLYDDVDGREQLVARFKSEAVKDQVVSALVNSEHIRQVIWDTMRRVEEGRA